jgi:PKD-like domain/GEVED domain/Secretion system C-terminal sorting domain
MKAKLILITLLFKLLLNNDLLAQISFIPVSVEGFNADVIANWTGSPVSSTTADADNAGYYFIDSTFKHQTTDPDPLYYLPVNGKIISQNTPGNYYELAPYFSSNALRLDNVTPFGTLNLPIPQAAYTLYVLATSGSGASTCDITVTFSDNSSIIFNSVNVNDWFGGNPYAIKGIGRTFFNAPDPVADANNPRLYEIVLPISSNLQISSISFSKANSSSVLNIFAVSINARSPYCVSGPLSSFDPFDIGNISFGSLNNGNPLPSTFNSSSTNSYSDFTNLPLQSYSQGSKYFFSVSEIARFGVSGTSSVSAYIDYNQDSLFDENYEKIFSGIIDIGNGFFTVSDSIQISLNSLPGVTRLRVVLSENSSACGIYYKGETEDYAISVQSAPLCSSLPNSGITEASDSSVCADTLFRLKLIGNSLSSGIQYQWEESIDSLNWNPIIGANYTELVTSQDTSKYYRCISTCTNSGLTSVSNTLYIQLNPFYLCYCAPLNNTFTITENIGNFLFNGLANGSDTTSINNQSLLKLYSDYRYLSPATIVQGAKDSMTVTVITSNSYLSEDLISAFIDFNHDKFFDPIKERVFNSLTSTVTNGNIQSRLVSVPYTALTGITGLRLIVSSSTYSSIDPCGFLYDGEIEDYLVAILPAPACTGVPVAGEAASYLPDICYGQKTDIRLKNTEQGNGLSYQWQQSSDSLNWLNIANSNDTVLNSVQISASYYRCIVSCISGFSDTSSVLKLLMRPSTRCYCSDSLSGEPYPTNRFISNVSILGTTLNNSSSASPIVNASTISVFSPSAQSTAQIYRDSSYALTVTTTSDYAISCWIDFDQNGIFDTYEWTQVTTGSSPGFADTALILVPSNAKPGLTGMRIRQGDIFGVNDSTSACANFFDEGNGRGEIEDYFVTIQCIAPPDSASAIQGPVNTGACINQTGIEYRINPIDNAVHYSWSLPSGASISGNPDTNSVLVNFAQNALSGFISVVGKNACGDGIGSSLFINYKQLPVPDFCRATIDSALQKTVLEWQKPTESYITDFIIYREISGIYTAIDTVSNALFSSYIDTGSHPELKTEKYKIAVLDSCGSSGTLSAIIEHETIRLYGSVQPGGIAKLYWNDYKGINDPTRYYNLLRDTTGNGPFNDTLASNINPVAYMNFSDPQSASYPSCRYVIEMVFYSNCTPSARMLLNKSTSRSNIKNKTALFDSSSVGINQIHFNFDGIKVYPNPAKEKLLISNLNQNFTYEIELINSIGECVQRTIISGSPIKELNLGDYPSGLYFINVKSRTDQRSYKIQIE